MASKNTQRVNERLQLAEQAAAAGNYQAAVNYAQAAQPYSRSDSSNANVQRVIDAYSGALAAAQQPPQPPGGGNNNNNNNNNGGGGGGGGGRTITGYRTGYGRGGYDVTYAIYSDGTEAEIGRQRNRGAGDAAEEMFANLGLGEAFSKSLRGTIDEMYNRDRAPSSAEIMTAIRTSEPYKQRFKANEEIRKRMENGQGRPGDRILSPAEYIDAENTYRTILADADMPEGFYDSPEDFVGLISNSISANEFKSRVDTAFDALNYADQNTMDALQSYYGLNRSDMVSYLLDPSRALPAIQARQAMMASLAPTQEAAGPDAASPMAAAVASPMAMAMTDSTGAEVSANADGVGAYGGNSREQLQKMYRASKFGGFGAAQGLKPGREFSEEIAGTSVNEDAVKRSFTGAAKEQGNVSRLGRLYGQPMDFQDVIREDLDLAGGAESGRKRKKFASKERAQFGQQSGLGRSSLRRRTDV